MCMISGYVKKVSNTKILVAPLKTGLSSLASLSGPSSLSSSSGSISDLLLQHAKTMFPDNYQDQVEQKSSVMRQLTVYCNQVSMEGQNLAMILPFPKSTNESTCDLVDLSKYPTLFDDLNTLCFPQPETMYTNSYHGASTTTNALQIVQSGSYKVTVVPCPADFALLQNTFFQLDQDVIDFVCRMYPNGFGFVVCKLDSDKKYHPFGYMHDSLAGNSMFIPTMHYHKHSSHSSHSGKHKKQTVHDPSFSSAFLSDHSSSSSSSRSFVGSFSGSSSFSSLASSAGSSTGSSVYAPFDSAQSHDTKSQAHTTGTDWDHEIYCFNRSLAWVPSQFTQTHAKHSETRPLHRLLQLHLLPPVIEPVQNVFAYQVDNYHQNHDLQCSVLA